MTEQSVSYTPLDVPLPPISTETVFSDLQWETLLTLADTVIPSIRGDGSQSNSSTHKVVRSSDLERAVSTLAASIPGPDATQLARRYLEERPSDNPQFKAAIQRLFTEFVPEEGKNGMSLILKALKYASSSLSPSPCQSCAMVMESADILQYETRLSDPHRFNHSHHRSTARVP